jgi:hypothetical protein
LELPDGRLSATIAWFALTKVNIELPLLEPGMNQSGVLFLTGNAHSGTRTVMPGYPRRWIASYRVEF